MSAAGTALDCHMTSHGPWMMLPGEHRGPAVWGTGIHATLQARVCLELTWPRKSSESGSESQTSKVMIADIDSAAATSAAVNTKVSFHSGLSDSLMTWNTNTNTPKRL